MSSKLTTRLLFFLLLLILHTCSLVSCLNQDGVLLLSFKYSILNDPVSALSNWNYDDDTPCSWNGVMCMGFTDNPNKLNSTSRVISLVLPNAQLLGSIPADLGSIQHLRHLDLSNNMLNGTLPSSLFDATELKILSLSNNEISGEIPDLFGNLTGLKLVNLSDNAFTGGIPTSLPLVPNISVLGLSNNYLSGGLPGGGFAQVQVLDLSSNLFNGSVPPDIVASSTSGLQYLNLSSNRLSGRIPSELETRMPASVVLDFSFNNLMGEVPSSAVFSSQSPAAFAGNPDLCGKPLKNMCTIPSSLSGPPNVTTTSTPESPPALAAIPNTTVDGGGGSSAANGARSGSGGVRPATVAAIVIGDLGGIAVLCVVFLYVYQVKKRKRREMQQEEVGFKNATESKARGSLSCCLRKKNNDGEEETSDSTSGYSEADEEEGRGVKSQGQQNQQGATLVTVDGDTELEMETLLKASAYILGATGSTIVYKAVLADGTALAVRRVGERRAIEKLKDFEAVVKSISKLRHPNLLRIWGFYWGTDEKLLIHDYAPNGSLANISLSSRKSSSSPFNLDWEARLRIARGLARGLAYIHEKRAVHGNIKPSNILLGANMEAKIGDFGLDRILSPAKPGTSARLFGSKRSMQCQGSLLESLPVTGASPIGSGSVTGPSSLPYQAPESLQNLKPNAKWDVYSFGMVLLELISGRVFSEEELSQWNAGFTVEERNQILRMADPALRGDVEGREEAILSCFKLGFACAVMAPQKRPTMKDAAMILDRIPSTSPSFLLY